MNNLPEDPKERALYIIARYGGFDGAHHKTWVIDQVVRALTDSPIRTDYKDPQHPNEYQEESEGYKKFVTSAVTRENEGYEWDTGSPP